MDLLRERLKARGAMCAVLCKGSSSSTTGATTVTNNNDKRNAVQDGVGVSGDSNFLSSYTNTTDSHDFEYSDAADRSIHDYSTYNDTDAVKAIANAGADIIKSSGGAVVDLARFQGAQNTEAWNTTITAGANLVDRLIDQVGDGFALSEKVVGAFTPTENKNADIGKYAMLAAAAVAAAVLLGKKS